MGFTSRTQGLSRPIFAIAIPAIVTNITTPLLGICDISIAGHRGGVAFIASLAVATSMFNMLYWLFGFLRMGSSGLTAQAFGARDDIGQSMVLWRGLILAVSAGLVVIVLQRPAARCVLWLMDVDSSTAGYAMRYFGIVVWGAPAVLTTYALTGWFLGMQNSKVPMYVSLFTDVVNIAVSVVLVFGVGLDIEGVAYGTLSAQWLAAVVGLIICIIRFRPVRPDLRGVFSGNGLRLFFRVNSDIFMRTLCLVAVSLWFTRAGAMQGAVMLAVNALLMQLFTLFSYVMDGFAFAGEALSGRFLGAGDHAMLRRTVRAILTAGAILALIFSICYFVAGDAILSLLTSDNTVVSAASDYLPWAMTVPLAGFLAFGYDGLMIGQSRTREMLLSMLLSMLLFFGLYAVLFPAYGNHGLWISFLAYLLSRGAVLCYVDNRQRLRSEQ